MKLVSKTKDKLKKRRLSQHTENVMQKPSAHKYFTLFDIQRHFKILLLFVLPFLVDKV